MSDLKTLLAEAKASLHDLEGLLQRARSLDTTEQDEESSSREEIQSCFEEILRIIESIPENLKLEESLQRKQEIKQLHLEMEQVRRRVEGSIGLLEAACERNVAQLAEFVERLERSVTSVEEEGQATESMSQLNELLRQGRACLESKDYQTCVTLMGEALDVAPNNPEAVSCLNEAQRKWEDQRLEEELVVHIENLKKDAMDLFDQEKYAECAGMFRFLCELEPKNRSLQDFLELSQRKVQEAAQDAAPESKGNESSAEAGPIGGPGEALAAAPSPVPRSAADDPWTASPLEDAVASAWAQDQIDDAARRIPAPEALPESATVQLPRVPEVIGHEMPLPVEDSNATAVETKPFVAKNRLFAVFGVMAVVVVVLAGFLIYRSLKSAPPGNLEIDSEPAGANVFVDGELRGQTPLYLESVEAGQHQLRIEKVGYAPLVRSFEIAPEKKFSLSAQLDPLATRTTSLDRLEQDASELYDRGRFLASSRLCDSILRQDPQNSMAAALKDKIRSQYWQQSQSAKRRGRTQDVRIALENLLKVAPQDAAALRELKALNASAKKESDQPPSEAAQLLNQIEALHRQIAEALNSGKYFPPASGNAFSLVQRLGEISPSDPGFKQGMDQLHRESISQLQRRIQSKDLEAAKTLARQFQTYFPASAELRNLRESLMADESKQAEQRNALMQKLDLAMSQGNYVTPVSDSALAYSNRLLAIDSQNLRVLALRREALTRAAAQARSLTAEARYDEARDVLSSLLILAQSEGRPVIAHELRAQLTRLEFDAYPVIHDHTLGSCSGRLRMNAYVLEYRPSGDSKDGFSVRLSELSNPEAGDKLKVQVKNKTYRFQPNLSGSKDEARKKVQEIRQRLETLMSR